MKYEEVITSRQHFGGKHCSTLTMCNSSQKMLKLLTPEVQSIMYKILTAAHELPFQMQIPQTLINNTKLP